MYKKIISMLLTLTLILGMFSSALPVFAEGEDATASVSYEKVSKLEAGKTYVITSNGKGMNATANDGYVNNNGSYQYSGFSGTDVTVADNKIASAVTNDMLWTAETSGNGFAFKNASNGKYLNAFYNGGNANNGIRFGDSPETWTFNGSTLKHAATTSSSGKDKCLAWDTTSDVSGGIKSGNADLFTIRSTGDTITFYVVNGDVTDVPGGDEGGETPDTPDTPVTPDPTPGAVNGTFTKVTGLTDGATYVITSNGMGMNATAHAGYVNSTNYGYSGFAGTAVTVSGDKITSSVTNDMLWTAEAVSGGFAFKNVSADQYLNATYYSSSSSNKGGFIAFGDSAQTWTYNGTTLKHTESGKSLTWELESDAQGGIQSGSANFFTIRSTGDTITFYLAEIVEDGGDTCQHEWADATCTAPKTCTLCEATDGEALGHEFAADWTVDVEATCGAAGSESRHCSRCTETTDERTINATGEHDYATEVESIESTCKIPGYITMACACGATKTTDLELDAEKHVGETEIRDSVAATCGVAGYTGDEYCLDCDAKIADGEVIAATDNHALTDEVTKVAMCNETGIRTYTCSVCGYTYDETIEKDFSNHTGNTDIRDAVPATCGVNGYTGDKYCSDCDTVLEYGEVIDSTNEHSYESAVTKEPTCSESGVRTFTCTVCGVSYTEDITATGEHNFATEVENVASTCKTPGYITKKCACGETETTYLELDAENHENIVVVPGTDATCTDSGLTEGRYCSVCDETLAEQETIDVLGHNWSPCTATCTRCDAAGDFEAEGHNYILTEVKATCISTGTQTFVCDKCDDTYTDTTAVDPDNHTGETEVRGYEAATCGEDGYTGDTYCLACEKVSVPGEVITATGDHDYTDATCTEAKTCTVCGATDGEANGHTEATREENRIEATCGAEGSYTLVTYCTVCTQELSSEAMTIPATGEHNFEEEVENVASTCSTFGHITMKCTCGETETTYSEAKDENNHETEVVIDAKDPTCTEAGRTAGKYCASCNKVFELQTEIPALGHSFTDYTSNEDATCTENGTETATCDRCDATDTREAADSALGHDWADATCTDPMTCKRENCGATEGEALGHSFTDFVSNNDATCTEDGTKTAICDNGCNSKTTVKDEGTAGHDIVIDEAVAPTCTETGLTEGQHCSRCDEATIPQKTVDFADHDLKDVEGTKTCTVCGETTEWGAVKVIITADKATAEPADDITFTVELSPVQSVDSIEFALDVPTGLTFKSAEFASGLKEKFGATVCEFDADNYKVSVISNDNAYSSTEMTEILTVTFTVNKGFTGSLALDATDVCLTDAEETLEVETDISDAVVTVSCSHANYVNEVAVKYLKSSATCTAAAVYYKSCEFCYEASTETFEDGEELGHNIVKDAAVAPTCEKTGLTEGSHCDRCNDESVKVAQTEIAALGHKYTTYVSNNDATCTEDGTKTAVCDNGCNSTSTKTDEGTAGHKWVDATCTAPKTCSVCNTTEGNALDHKWVDATCTAPKTCSVCNTTDGNPLGHNEETKEENRVDPSCTTNGSYDTVTYCSVCNNELSRVTTSVSALGHNEETKEENRVDPSCTTNGSYDTVTYCSVCNNELSRETTSVLALDHDWQQMAPVLPECCTRCGLSRNATVELIITADKETAKAGETITYTVSLGPVYMLDAVEFKLDIPEGLKFKSGALVDGLADTLKAAACNFNSDKLKVAIAGCLDFETLAAYTSVENTPILTFTCTVEKDADGDIIMGVDTENWYFADFFQPINAVLVNEGSKVNIPCTHSEITVHEAVASSCTTPGHAEYSTCNNCGIIVDGSDEALELDPENHVDVTVYEAVHGTCENPGHAEYTECNECGILVSGSKDAVTNDPHGNSQVEAEAYIKTPGTCTTATVYYKSCELCGVANITTFTAADVIGHDMVAVTGTPATCTEAGITDGEKCSRCDETTQTVIPATGHTWAAATCETAKTCVNCGLTDGEALGHTWTDATCTAPVTCTACNKTEGEALGHTWTDATCTTAKTCTVCQATEGEALGHNLTILEGKDATCTTDGLTTGEKCSRCDYEVAQVVIPATGHTWTAATCTEAKTCSVCQATEGTALGHDMVKDAAVDPTCTTVGYTEGAHCSRCDDEKVAQIEIPALGHDITKTAGYAATCTTTGLTDGEKCSRCDYEVAQEEIAALGHDVTVIPGYEASCSNTGLTDGEKCSRCDYEKAQNIIPALGHEIVSVGAVAPTCTETGLTEKTYCSRCSEVLSEQTVVAALGHDMVKDAAVEPTCTQTGLTEGAHCSRCDEKVAQQVIDARGHNFAAATCTEAKTCKACGATEGSALGHKVTEATCTEASVCTVCNEVVSEANGHRFADATCTSPETCTVCGTTQGEALGHKWIEASYDAPKTCERCGAVEGDVLPSYKVSGTVTSFGSSTDEITVILKDSDGNIVHTATTIGNNATFFISDVKSGTYTMVVSKNGHTAREYTVVVADADATQNAAIALTGDLNFDGKVNVVDINMIYDHVLETTLITDEYALQCADMNGDGEIDISDNNLLYNKVLGV